MTPRLRIRDIVFEEREVPFRAPFRFGAFTVTRATQMFVRASVEIENDGIGRGATAELMVPKWFNKDPALTPEAGIEQLRRSLAIARELWLADRSFDTAFGHHAKRIAAHIETCGREKIPPLAASFGMAEIDKAVLDALLRGLNLDVFAAFRTNVVGIDARLTPELSDAGILHWLESRRPLPAIAVRHTVGLTDPVEGTDGPVDFAGRTGCRFFKIKLGGDPAADASRLAAIAAGLDRLGLDYRVSLDANEQYADAAALAGLIEFLRRDLSLATLAARLLYIEQPLPRERTFEAPLPAAAREFDFIIDEADDGYDAFPGARELGYRGVSSKSCKGIYKSLLNGVRAAMWEGAFVTAEDLTCQAGLALQQDSALVAFHGITHAERNGHHYVDGFAGTPHAQARAFLAGHPDLYEEHAGTVRVAVRDGEMAVGSLKAPGFASAVLPLTEGRPPSPTNPLAST